MNTLELAKAWEISLEDAIQQMAEKGLYIIDPYEKLSDFQLQLVGYYEQDGHKETIEQNNEHEDDLNDSLPFNSSPDETDILLDYFIFDSIVFIDCCSLLEPCAGKLLDRMIPYLLKYHQRLIIPYVVMNELKKLKTSKPELAKSISIIEKKIDEMQQKDCMIFVKGDNDVYFADPNFLSNFHQLRFQTNIMLITQDIDLTIDALSINNSRAAKSKYRISVCRIEGDGRLRERILLPSGELAFAKRADNKHNLTHKIEESTTIKQILSESALFQQEAIDIEALFDTLLADGEKTELPPDSE